MLFTSGSGERNKEIFRQYGKNAIKVVTEDTYRPADEICGVGFKTAYTTAKKLGFGAVEDINTWVTVDAKAIH